MLTMPFVASATWVAHAITAFMENNLQLLISCALAFLRILSTSPCKVSTLALSALKNAV